MIKLQPLTYPIVTFSCFAASSLLLLLSSFDESSDAAYAFTRKMLTHNTSREHVLKTRNILKDAHALPTERVLLSNDKFN